MQRKIQSFFINWKNSLVRNILIYFRILCYLKFSFCGLNKYFGISGSIYLHNMVCPINVIGLGLFKQVHQVVLLSSSNICQLWLWYCCNLLNRFMALLYGVLSHGGLSSCEILFRFIWKLSPSHLGLSKIIIIIFCRSKKIMLYRTYLILNMLMKVPHCLLHTIMGKSDNNIVDPTKFEYLYAN